MTNCERQVFSKLYMDFRPVSTYEHMNSQNYQVARQEDYKSDIKQNKSNRTSSNLETFLTQPKPELIKP